MSWLFGRYILCHGAKFFKIIAFIQSLDILRRPSPTREARAGSRSRCRGPTMRPRPISNLQEGRKKVIFFVRGKKK